MVFKPRMDADVHGWMGDGIEPRNTRNECGSCGGAKFHLSRCGGGAVVFKPRMNADDHGWMGM